MALWTNTRLKRVRSEGGGSAARCARLNAIDPYPLPRPASSRAPRPPSPMKRGLVPLVVGGWLYIVVAIFTQPVSDSLIDVRCAVANARLRAPPSPRTHPCPPPHPLLQRLVGLSSSFSPTAAYNAGLIVVELLVVAGAQWAIRHGLVNDELSAELLVPQASGGVGPRAVGSASGDEEAGLLSGGGRAGPASGSAAPQTASSVLAAIRNRARVSAATHEPTSGAHEGGGDRASIGNGGQRPTLPGPSSQAR